MPSSVSLQRERSMRVTRSMDIIRCYANGDLVEDIQTLHECSRNTVLRLARLAGLPKRPKCFSVKIKEATLSMLKSGNPLAQIQAQLGVSQAYASKLAKEHGLQRYKR